MLGTTLALILAVTPVTYQNITPLENNTQEIECLAQNIYHEARNQGYKGMQAVANVTMNRVKSVKYKDTVCEVVYEKYRLKSGKYSCQFSWTCRKSKITSPKYSGDRAALDTAYKIASMAVNGELQDITKGALSFHDKSLRTKGLRIGDHVFF